MDENNIDELLSIIDRLEVTENNRKEIDLLNQLADEGRFIDIAQLIQKMREEGKLKLKNEEIDEMDDEEEQEEQEKQQEENEEAEEQQVYPESLSNLELEERYISLLLANPKSMSMYYILFEDCYFESPVYLNLYKSILFKEGEAYAPQIAKDNFNYAQEDAETYQMKIDLREKGRKEKYDFEKTYLEIRKLFEIRKNYLRIPLKETQDKIIDILKYELYDRMTIQEVKDAIEQITATEKFKRGVLTSGVTNFFVTGENELTDGLELPFPILSSVFKGIRKGETMAYAMPSNSGKSRFTINLAANIAFVHRKKVLIISNEMSEEKMRLCLITTVINNPEIQKIHGIKIKKTEGELLEFKFRPDEGKDVKVDENGFIVKEEGEKQLDFAKRLLDLSEEFKNTIRITNWIDSQMKNSIFFVNITDHTNDELEKVILNYYYKEKMEYVFYDTLKTDTANIGVAEEIKKTATILSNLAQNLKIFIASSLQLTESSTLPINLDVNDLAVSRTVKEVLDTLCLIKQIHNEDLEKYEYSLEEVDTKFYDLKKFKDPDVRYYACVVDKNRAGAKPKVVFRLNLAYNSWEELGYLRMKQ